MGGSYKLERALREPHTYERIVGGVGVCGPRCTHIAHDPGEIGRRLSVAQQKAIVSYYGRPIAARTAKVPTTATRGVVFDLGLITSPLDHDARLTELGAEVLRALGGTLVEQVQTAKDDAATIPAGVTPIRRRQRGIAHAVLNGAPLALCGVKATGRAEAAPGARECPRCAARLVALGFDDRVGRVG